MSTWSQLRNVDAFGRGLGGDNISNQGISNLIDLGSLSNYGSGAATGLGDLNTLSLTASPVSWTNSLKGMFGNFSGTRNADGSGSTGWGMPAISALSGLMNGFMGMKNYGLAKDQFNFSKEMANKNLANQTKMVNGQLEDRQRARVASNPGAYQSVDAYMKERGI